MARSMREMRAEVFRSAWTAEAGGQSGNGAGQLVQGGKPFMRILAVIGKKSAGTLYRSGRGRSYDIGEGNTEERYIS